MKYFLGGIFFIVFLLVLSVVLWGDRAIDVIVVGIEWVLKMLKLLGKVIGKGVLDNG